MPGNRDDDDAPRWELPVWDPSKDEATPLWEDEPEVPRWQPRRGAGPAERVGPGARVGPGPRVGSAAPTAQRESPKRVSPLGVPFVWWAAHPWVVLWTLVLLAPGAALLLRVLHESELDALMLPLAWGLAALFVIALSLPVVASARRSVVRLVLGTL